ncbi:MAG: sorbosone dehydrogenase family protein [Salinirussus sp.]
MPRLSRRQYVAGVGAAFVSLAGCSDGPAAGSDTPAITDTPTDAVDGSPPSVELGAEPIATGFTSPVDIVVLEPGRYLIADQPGLIHLIEAGETQTVLDLREQIVSVSGYTEQGLLGIAIHPTDNERLFVRYSAPPRPDTPDGYSHTFVLSEFTMEPGSGDIHLDSEQILLEIPEPQPNHNAGDLVFGPDDLLYVPVGDGGAAGDQGAGHVEDWYTAVGGGNGQDITENLLGSILRIDVDGTSSNRPYEVPEDNPLVGRSGRDEHFAWGLRNPWRLSFDPSGRCLAADVGQNRYEEVNVIEKGGNYGWNVREGTDCFGASECPTTTPDGDRLRPPVIQYGHGDAPVSGIAIIGGRFYQGAAIPALSGQYVFGDWQAGDRLFVAAEQDEGLWPTGVLPVSGDAGPLLLTISEDADDELLIATTREGGVRGETGAIHRLVPTE